MRERKNESDDLNEGNLFVYLVRCEDYDARYYEDANISFLILANTIEEATEETHHRMTPQYKSYRITSIEFIGSVGIYIARAVLNNG